MQTTDLYDRHLSQLSAALVTLPDKPEETPATTLKALWQAANGQPMSVEAADQAALPMLTADGEAQLETLIARRLAGEPLAHITGRQRFMGLDFLAGPEALVPRKESEQLGQIVLARISGLGAHHVPVQVIDLCTGSGNLALSVAHYAPATVIRAADLSEEAVALARRNAALHGLASRVSFSTGDLFGALEPAGPAVKADIVMANPPFYSSAKVGQMADEIARFEPRLAFDGGGFGLDIVGRLIKGAPDYLKPQSWLCFEVGKGQGPYWTKAIGRLPAYATIETIEDAEGQLRFIAARTH